MQIKQLLLGIILLLTVSAANAMTVNVVDATTSASLNATIIVNTTGYNINTTYDLSSTDEGGWFSGVMNSVSPYNSTAVYLSSRSVVGRYGFYNPTTNISYDLSATDTADWVSTGEVYGIKAYNSTAVYIMTRTKFGVYNPTTNVSTQLGSVGGFALENYNTTAIYYGGTSSFGYYNPSTNSFADLTATDTGDWIGASSILWISAYNSTAVYIGIASGKFGVYNPVTNVTYDLSATDPLGWIAASNVYSVSAYNSTAVYMGLQSGKFGVYNPTTNISYELTSSDVGNWFGTNSLFSINAQNSTTVYIGTVGGGFGFYNPVTNISYDLSSTDAAGWLGTSDVYSISAYNSSAVYLTASSAKFGVYNPEYLQTTQTYNATSGTVTFDLSLYRTATFTVSSTGYTTVTGSGINLSIATYVFNLTANSNTTFILVDELTGQIINTSTSTVELSSLNYGGNVTTTNGRASFYNLTYGLYTVTYNSTNYTQRTYRAYLPSTTNASIVLYLLPSTEATTVRFTVADTNNFRLTNATVYINKKNASGTNYYLVATCTTDTNGQCTSNVQLIDTTYRFLVYYNGAFRADSLDTTVTATEIAIPVGLIRDPLAIFFAIPTISTSLTYTASGTATWTVADSTGNTQQGCVRLYRRTGLITQYINGSCASGATFITTSYQNTSLGDETYAIGTIYIEGTQYQVTRVSVANDDLSGASNTGLILLAVIFAVGITLALKYAWDMTTAMIMFFVSTTMFWYVGLLQISSFLLVSLGLLIMIVIARNNQ